MEVRESGELQSRRSSIKRPWEADASFPEGGGIWNSNLHPRSGTGPYYRESIHQDSQELKWNSQDQTESAAKRAKFERHDYNTFSRQNLALNGTIPPSRMQDPEHDQSRSSLESPSYPTKLKAPNEASHRHSNGNVPPDNHDISSLCRQCRRSVIQARDPSSIPNPDGCEDCKRSPDLQRISLECSTVLTQLAETLASGISSSEIGIAQIGDQHHESLGYPPIETYGPRKTLNWILGRIYHCNQIAERLVRQVSADSYTNRSKDNSYSHGTPADIMKRRLDVDSVDLNEADSSSDTIPPHLRRRSVTTSVATNEEQLLLRSQPDYYPALPPIDGSAQRHSGMNPPLGPSRQLHSSPGPGRSLPSPTSLSLPSPSSSSTYGVNAQGLNHLPAKTIHQQNISNYLPPMSAPRPSDAATRDYTAALQHEVSVQKIALSSLQGEHDKLLAAFSRSQTRASALEKKHAVSDTEIIGLTEEKLRLQALVNDLEKDVEELTRSKDEFRQAAVQEGAQYVEIVQKASRLEEITGEERRNWGNLRMELERTIAALRTGHSSDRKETRTENDSSAPEPDETHTDAPSSSIRSAPEMQAEVVADQKTLAPRPDTSRPFTPRESVEDLKAEIHRLRERCVVMETALRAIRDDGRSMEDLIKTFTERADATLQN